MLCFSMSQHSQMSLSVKKADETYGILYSFSISAHTSR